MARYTGRAATTVPAPPPEVFAALTDYERLPSWQRAVRRATVLERDAGGRGREVAYEIDVRLGTVRYVLRHGYEDDRQDVRRITSEYVRGDFRDCEGAWTLVPEPLDATRAEFALRIDPGRRIPGPAVRLLNEVVLRGAVEDLRRRFAG